MGHTNSTTNYNLPQFITTDKPAWLTDVNNAFLAIDTGMDAAKDAADAAQGDATQALTDAGNASTAAATADAKGSGAVASIADTFDSTTVYAVGEKVMYNSLLYTCSVAVTTPGPWTGSANWSRTTVETIVNNLTASDINYSVGVSTAQAMGSLASLTTSNKDSLVDAINEVGAKIKVKNFNGTTDSAGNLLIPDLTVLGNTVISVVLGSGGYCTSPIASGSSWYVKVLTSTSYSPVTAAVNQSCVAYAIYM